MQAQSTTSSKSLWLKRMALILAALLVLAGLVYLGKALMSGGTSHKKAVTTVKLLPDTPPPPPPPPKEPPKEQPKEIKEVKEIQQPKPDPSPPSEVLKMEGAAGDGPSPFASGAVNNEYKGGDVGTKIGGANKYQFAYYTGMIKSQIEQALAKDKTLASGAYKVVVKVWVATNGRIQRFEIAGSSGDPTIDALIKKAVDEMPALTEPPPSDMPQPVKMRVTARSVG